MQSRGEKPARRRGRNDPIHRWAGELQLARFRGTRDPAERDALFERFLPLANSVAARFSYTQEPLDDLRQVAAIGLLKALDRFDPSRGFAFSSYAVPTMLGEIRRHLRDNGSTMRLPRSLQELGPRVARARQALESELGRSPTARELAAHLGITEEEVLDASGALAASRPASLDEPLAPSDGGETLGEVVGTEDDGFAGAETAALASQYMAHLTLGEQRVLRLYFEADLTQREIGAIVGVSQMQVSRLLRRSIAQLQAIVAAEGARSRAAEPCR